MLKSIRFRNSGKLDLGGKGVEVGLTIVIIAIIGLAIAVVIGVSRSKKGGPLVAPEESRVKCIKCNEEWTIGRDEIGAFTQEMRPRGGSRSMGGDCPKCEGVGTAYIMIKCPKCGEYYMPIRATKPFDYAAGKAKDVCPKCGQDLVQWHVDHHRR